MDYANAGSVQTQPSAEGVSYSEKVYLTGKCELLHTTSICGQTSTIYFVAKM